MTDQDTERYLDDFRAEYERTGSYDAATRALAEREDEGRNIKARWHALQASRGGAR